MYGRSGSVGIDPIENREGVISVHLGPDWYIGRLDTKIEKGDRVEVRGSRVTMTGEPVIIASEVRKGGETLKLRDEAGVPVWAGWRR